jgi:hypothetical protein
VLKLSLFLSAAAAVVDCPFQTLTQLLPAAERERKKPPSEKQRKAIKRPIFPFLPADTGEKMLYFLSAARGKDNFDIYASIENIQNCGAN